MRNAAAVHVAALLHVVGMDGMRFLTTEDEMERIAMQAVGERAAKLLEQRDKSLAVLIGNAVARCFRG